VTVCVLCVPVKFLNNNNNNYYIISVCHFNFQLFLELTFVLLIKYVLSDVISQKSYKNLSFVSKT